MNQAQSSQLGLPQAGTTGQRRGFPSPGPAGSPGLSAQGLNLALLDELAAPQLLDLPVQVADFRHGPPPRRGSEPGPPPPPHRTGVSAAATLARAFGVPAVLFPSALGRRHRCFHFRPRRGSKGRPVPPHDGCGVIHTLPLPRRTLNPTSGA